jgi:hypothetical protein
MRFKLCRYDFYSKKNIVLNFDKQNLKSDKKQ